MFCLIKKLLDTKWKEFKVKNIKQELMKLTKLSLSCFDDKTFVLDYEIHTLAYFHKDSFTSCTKIEKDCDDWKRFVKNICVSNGMNSY